MQLKISAQRLAAEGTAKTLIIAATGQQPQQVSQRERLSTGVEYVFPVGQPVERLARLAAEIRLFWALLEEFNAAVIVAPQPVPAVTTRPFDTPNNESAGGPIGLIRKYYPNLGEHLISPTLPDLAAEWYSDLCRLGIKDIDYYVAERHERASNKAEFKDCVAMLLTEVEQHAHISGYGYRRHYPPDYLTPEQEAAIEASGRAALRAVGEWHTLAILSPIEQFLERARKIELWQNDRHQLATRKEGFGEWREEYAVLLMALQRAIPTAKKRLLRAAYTELNRLLPTLKAGRPLKWQRLYDEGYPFFSSSLTDTYPYSEFGPLRPTQTTTSQITEFFFQHLHIHLFAKEWHVWQALILLAGALGEATPPTPETFQKKQTEPAPSAPRPEQAPADTLRPGPPVLLSAGDRILAPGFTLDEVDRLARAVGLTNEAGNYYLGPRKLGAVVGFALALQQAGKLTGAIPALTAVLGPRWSVQVATRKTTTTVAQHYFSLTNKALARPKKTD